MIHADIRLVVRNGLVVRGSYSLANPAMALMMGDRIARWS
jgi:hypothetical protein